MNLPGNSGNPTEIEEHLRRLALSPEALQQAAPPQPALRMLFHPAVSVAFGPVEMLPPGLRLPGISDTREVRSMMLQVLAPDGATEVHFFWFDRGGFRNALGNAFTCLDADDLEDVVRRLTERQIEIEQTDAPARAE